MTAATPLPEPLSLDQVLSHIDQNHPELAVVNAALEEARAQQQKVEAQSGIYTSLVARLRWIDPPEIAYDQSQDDHSASLYVRKRLYDFGRSDAREAAAQWAVSSNEWRYEDALNQYRLAIMAAFFDAILSDLKFAAANEAMSIAFVTLDRARTRNELGQMSDIDLLELESEYQKSRTKVHRASYEQRTTRAYLADLLNQPGHLPSELTRPDLPVIDRKVPDVEAWLKEAENNNPTLKSLQAAVSRAKQQLAAAEAGHRPFMDGELEMSRYNREAGSYDDWRATLSLNVPITTGGSVESHVAERRAQWQAAKARLEQARRDVHQAVLETWSDLNVLRTKRDEMYALMDYRDLYLERSRAEYELELKTDLGDAMARMSDAQRRMAQTEFETALAWAKLDALLGRKVYDNKETMP